MRKNRTAWVIEKNVGKALRNFGVLIEFPDGESASTHLKNADPRNRLKLKVFKLTVTAEEE